MGFVCGCPSRCVSQDFYTSSLVINIIINPKKKNNHYVIIFAVVSILTYLSGIAITVAGVKFKSVASHFTYFYNQEKINVLIICVSLFMIFFYL